MMRLRVEGEGRTAHGFRVHLNDEEITDRCRALSVSVEVGEVNTATLEIYLDQLDIDADVQAEIINASPDLGRGTLASRIWKWLSE